MNVWVRYNVVFRASYVSKSQPIIFCFHKHMYLRYWFFSCLSSSLLFVVIVDVFILPFRNAGISNKCISQQVMTVMHLECRQWDFQRAWHLSSKLMGRGEVKRGKGVEPSPREPCMENRPFLCSHKEEKTLQLKKKTCTFFL